jgi:hypothetical protein
MKISLSDLEDIAATGCANQARPHRDDCPSPERLVLCARSAVSKKEKSLITSHLMTCGDCAAEVKTILAVFAEEKTLLRDLKQPNETGFPRWHPAWKIAAAASAVVLVAALGVFLISRWTPRADQQRGPVPAIELASPVDTVYAGGELRFIWKGPAAKYCLVEVFDASLSLLWRSGRVVGNEVIAPEELTHKLKPRETYFWMITAVLEDEARVKSGLGEFKTLESLSKIPRSK